jgi:rfaE bifunctional protein kinase chain/domain
LQELLSDNKPQRQRLADIVGAFSGKRILVAGDAIADQFVYGEISRVSREAPVFILRHEHTETLPGGAANCAANLASLGAEVFLVGVTGDDEAGKSLMGKLEAAAVNCAGVVKSPEHRTTTKVRVLAGQLHSTRQQVIRIDYDSEPEMSTSLRDQLQAAIRHPAITADGIVISDYNYGVAGPDITQTIREASSGRGVPVLVDSRFQLSAFGGFTSATPNEDEVEGLLGTQHADMTGLESAAEQLRQRLGYQALLVTRGSRGMMLVEPAAPPLHIDAVGSHEPVDVTGAGDTVIATYTLALASGASFAEAARLANFAGGLVVMKRGTATVTAEEILASISSHSA